MNSFDLMPNCCIKLALCNFVPEIDTAKVEDLAPGGGRLKSAALRAGH
jgi:hypothetical protein